MKAKLRQVDGWPKIYKNGRTYRRIVSYDQNGIFTTVIRGEIYQVRPYRGRIDAFEVIRKLTKEKPQA